MLLDCGEGTLGQLWRKFGPAVKILVDVRASCFPPHKSMWTLSHAFSPSGLYLQSLDLVWISHMHADHHLGLMKFLEQREGDVSAYSDDRTSDDD